MTRTLLLMALLLIPVGASAQGPTLRVEGKGHVRLPAVTSHGYPAYPLRVLETLGATVHKSGGRATIVLDGDTLELEALSPFLRSGARVLQLANPVYQDGASFYAPLQLFAEVLPQWSEGRIAYASATLRRAAPGAADRPQSKPQSRSDATRVVVIDAGHGGRDPGKIGPNGLQEKVVTLAVARRLAALLSARGYEVHLTRTSDTLIALADRPRMANEWKKGRPAALFLSLHANAGPRAAHGFETFFLSEARTEDERRVAEAENAAARFEENRGGPSADALGHILTGLRNDFYIHASSTLAELTQQRMARFHPGPNRGVKQAGFRVLVGAFMPGVLVEMAFLSNPEEAALLGTSAFQQKVAWSLMETVEEFFTSHEHLWTEETR